jgi:hypothetical protein
MNAVVGHPGGYGIYKETRKIKGVVHCILVDPKTPGYADPAVKGDRYAVPIDQCTWAAPMAPVDVAKAALPGFPATTPQHGAWVTPDKPEWWQEFEQRLIEATTWEQLQQAKDKASSARKMSASRRREVMALWQCDGRYEWLQDKANRLRAESDAVEQGMLSA